MTVHIRSHLLNLTTAFIVTCSILLLPRSLVCVDLHTTVRSHNPKRDKTGGSNIFICFFSMSLLWHTSSLIFSRPVIIQKHLLRVMATYCRDHETIQLGATITSNQWSDVRCSSTQALIFKFFKTKQANE